MPLAEGTPEYLAKADDWASKVSKEAAKSTSDMKILKETGKDVLAVIMSDLAKINEGMSETKLERMARCEPRWREYRTGYYAAMEKSEIDEVRAKNAHRHWETAQSLVSYRKEEMRRIDGQR